MHTFNPLPTYGPPDLWQLQLKTLRRVVNGGIRRLFLPQVVGGRFGSEAYQEKFWGVLKRDHSRLPGGGTTALPPGSAVCVARPPHSGTPAAEAGGGPGLAPAPAPAPVGPPAVLCRPLGPGGGAAARRCSATRRTPTTGCGRMAVAGPSLCLSTPGWDFHRARPENHCPEPPHPWQWVTAGPMFLWRKKPP